MTDLARWVEFLTAFSLVPTVVTYDTHKELTVHFADQDNDAYLYENMLEIVFDKQERFTRVRRYRTLWHDATDSGNYNHEEIM